MLATLNNPNIGAIYGLEEAEGVTALVLELVEGETLAHRLERGPLPVFHSISSRRRSPMLSMRRMRKGSSIAI